MQSETTFYTPTKSNLYTSSFEVVNIDSQDDSRGAKIGISAGAVISIIIFFNGVVLPQSSEATMQVTNANTPTKISYVQLGDLSFKTPYKQVTLTKSKSIIQKQNAEVQGNREYDIWS